MQLKVITKIFALCGTAVAQMPVERPDWIDSIMPNMFPDINDGIFLTGYSCDGNYASCKKDSSKSMAVWGWKPTLYRVDDDYWSMKTQEEMQDLKGYTPKGHSGFTHFETRSYYGSPGFMKYRDIDYNTGFRTGQMEMELAEGMFGTKVPYFSGLYIVMAERSKDKQDPAYAKVFWDIWGKALRQEGGGRGVHQQFWDLYANITHHARGETPMRQPCELIEVPMSARNDEENWRLMKSIKDSNIMPGVFSAAQPEKFFTEFLKKGLVHKGRYLAEACHQYIKIHDDDVRSAKSKDEVSTRVNSGRTRYHDPIVTEDVTEIATSFQTIFVTDGATQAATPEATQTETAVLSERGWAWPHVTPTLTPEQRGKGYQPLNETNKDDYEPMQWADDGSFMTNIEHAEYIEAHNPKKSLGAKRRSQRRDDSSTPILLGRASRRNSTDNGTLPVVWALDAEGNNGTFVSNSSTSAPAEAEDDEASKLGKRQELRQKHPYEHTHKFWHHMKKMWVEFFRRHFYDQLKPPGGDFV